MNSRLFKSLFPVVFTLLIMAIIAFNTESNSEKYLLDYHDSKQYDNDISEIMNQATRYLQFRLTQNDRAHTKKKLAIVMDIDETALSNYKKLWQHHFQVTPEVLHQIGKEGGAPAILKTLAFYNFAKNHGVEIFFITGRPNTLSNRTLDNLLQAGYHDWKQVSFCPYLDDTNTVSYRIQERSKIQTAGYDIVMNIGNREATLIGGYADMVFKLPNPFYDLQ